MASSSKKIRTLAQIITNAQQQQEDKNTGLTGLASVDGLAWPTGLTGLGGVRVQLEFLIDLDL